MNTYWTSEKLEAAGFCLNVLLSHCPKFTKIIYCLFYCKFSCSHFLLSFISGRNWKWQISEVSPSSPLLSIITHRLFNSLVEILVRRLEIFAGFKLNFCFRNWARNTVLKCVITKKRKLQIWFVFDNDINMFVTIFYYTSCNYS